MSSAHETSRVTSQDDYTVTGPTKSGVYVMLANFSNETLTIPKATVIGVPEEISEFLVDRIGSFPLIKANLPEDRAEHRIPMIKILPPLNPSQKKPVDTPTSDLLIPVSNLPKHLGQGVNCTPQEQNYQLRGHERELCLRNL